MKLIQRLGRRCLKEEARFLPRSWKGEAEEEIKPRKGFSGRIRESIREAEKEEISKSEDIFWYIEDIYIKTYLSFHSIFWREKEKQMDSIQLKKKRRSQKPMFSFIPPLSSILSNFWIQPLTLFALVLYRSIASVANQSVLVRPLARSTCWFTFFVRPPLPLLHWHQRSRILVDIGHSGFETKLLLRGIDGGWKAVSSFFLCLAVP
jgi:hypothetical protein